MDKERIRYIAYEAVSILVGIIVAICAIGFLYSLFVIVRSYLA